MSLPLLFGSDCVSYSCSCGKETSIQWLYFCRHCSDSRCRSCASHEVDTQYCQHCLEYIPTIDGKLKKNRCSTCYSCPSCGFTLSSRVSVTPEGKSYYLSCLFCKWSTRDSRIPDSRTQSSPWPEPDDPMCTSRINDLYSHYKSLAVMEKTAAAGDHHRTRRLNPIRSNHHLHLLDKYGISAGLSPKVSASLREKFYSKQQQQQQQSSYIASPGGNLHQVPVAFKAEPGVSKVITEEEDRDTLNSLYQQPLDISNTSNIDQRLRAMELQPVTVSSFKPVSQMLSVKRSLRCKTCDHNLSKPECNPSSIKFKILLAAYYYLPEIRIKQWDTGSNLVLITVTNPTPYELKVELIPESVKEHPESRSRITSIAFTLPPKDETLDIELELGGRGGERAKKQVFPEEVIAAKGNKVTVKLLIGDPDPDEKKADTITAGEKKKRKSMNLTLCHDFVKALIHVPGSEKREPQIETVTQKVIIRQPITS